MKLKPFVPLLAILLLSTQANAQTPSTNETSSKKYFIGSSLFVLANLVPDDNSPDFAQVNFGYRPNSKNAFSIEAKTWKYAWPLGIPYGTSFEAPEEKYPGHIRDFGIALVYQRFIWKGFYGAIHGMNAVQRYVDEDGAKIQNGYMLFLTYRLGYHIPLFKNRFFIEPSLATTHWPIKTNVPNSFDQVDKNWPKYFLLEPGLHFGLKF